MEINCKHNIKTSIKNLLIALSCK